MCKQDTFSTHVGGKHNHEGVVQTHDGLELDGEAEGAEERGADYDEYEVGESDEGGVVRGHERESGGESMFRADKGLEAFVEESAVGLHCFQYRICYGG